jgi:hypothetical protein
VKTDLATALTLFPQPEDIPRLMSFPKIISARSGDSSVTYQASADINSRNW